MNFSQLKTAFESYVGMEDQVDDAQLAVWLNEAQLELAYDLAPVEICPLQATAGETFTPSADWLLVVASDLDYRLLPGGILQFTEGGSGRLYYRAMPVSFSGTDGGEESVLPAAVHHLLAQYAASRYWDMESEGAGEESALATKWLSYFYQGRNWARNRLLAAAADAPGWQVKA